MNTKQFKILLCTTALTLLIQPLIVLQFTYAGQSLGVGGCGPVTSFSRDIVQGGPAAYWIAEGGRKFYIDEDRLENGNFTCDTIGYETKIVALKTVIGIARGDQSLQILGNSDSRKDADELSECRREVRRAMKYAIEIAQIKFKKTENNAYWACDSHNQKLELGDEVIQDPKLTCKQDKKTGLVYVEDGAGNRPDFAVYSITYPSARCVR